MLGSEFLARFERLGLPTWEAAAFHLAQNSELTPWPWVDLPLQSQDGHSAVLKVQSDVLSVGPIGNHLRLPLTPTTAQNIANLSGALLPTPWLVYQMFRAAPVKLDPTTAVPNQGASLRQYMDHSIALDAQVDRRAGLVSGEKKHVVVSNAAKPGKVVIFGWYRRSGPVVFTDGQPMGTPGRQPIQPLSNAHGDFYVDYSHGIQLVHPECVVDGEVWKTIDLYTHPTLSLLVSHEGALKSPRYPSKVPPAVGRVVLAEYDPGVPTLPSVLERGFDFATPSARV